MHHRETHTHTHTLAFILREKATEGTPLFTAAAAEGNVLSQCSHLFGAWQTHGLVEGSCAFVLWKRGLKFQLYYPLTRGLWCWPWA